MIAFFWTITTAAGDLGYFELSLQINKLHHLREKFRDIVEFINPQFEVDEDLINNMVNSCRKHGRHL